jgi:hypothetical protein
MRSAALTSFALVGLVLASTAAPAPTGWRHLLPTVSGNVAIVNGQTLEVGDSAAMPAKNGTARVNCVRITRDSVLIAVEGEDELRVLSFK